MDKRRRPPEWRRFSEEQVSFLLTLRDHHSSTDLSDKELEELESLMLRSGGVEYAVQCLLSAMPKMELFGIVFDITERVISTKEGVWDLPHFAKKRGGKIIFEKL